MRLRRLILAVYGRSRDVGIDIGDGVTVVLGVNEAGKSTALDALGDLLWGIPRNTPRASEAGGRPQLRVDAVLDVGGTPRVVVRKSTGLFGEDLVTPILPPWDPEQRLTTQWWRTRLGLNHTDLREGGRDVFAGTGDIAEIIFAARQGRSARELLDEIADQADKLFKPHAGARKVQLRVAAKAYQDAVDERNARLTRAGDVVDQRAIVETLQGKRHHAKDAVTATSRLLKQAEEDQRVIEGVLELRRARSELAAIDVEGDRLSVAELAEYVEAAAALEDAQRRVTKLDSEIAGRERDIAELAVDDRLLDDAATLGRLQPAAKARIEDFNRAQEEFGPAVAEETVLLQRLLLSIGIETDGDLDGALDRARVRTDHSATLNELADRIEDLQDQRRQAKTVRAKALEDLLSRGIDVDFAESTVPSEEAIGQLRDALNLAHTEVATARGLLAKATDAVDALRAGEPALHNPAAVTPADVLAARQRRDALWGTIRRSWVGGELPDPAERLDIAAEFDKTLAAADRTADDEAAQRSQVAAQEARIAAHGEGLEAARRDEQSAAQHLDAAAEQYRRLENEWARVWTDLGVSVTPGIDSGSVVADLLVTVHVEDARDRSAADQIDELAESWSAAAELVGLPAACTTAAWRKQAEVLAEIESVQARRLGAQQRETQARRKWDQFRTEAVELLQRHDAVDESQPVTPASVEQGLAKLVRELSAATAAAATRTTYLEQVEEKRTEHAEAERAQQDALESTQRLAESHSVDVGPELAVLAERAERASDPIARQAAAERDIKNGLDKGSDLRDVLDRLADHDQVTVEYAVDDARAADEEARSAAESIQDEYTSATIRLGELEEAGGAAEAEADVAVRQAEVARLAETWAILALQRKLLEAVLAGLGSDDTRPLLDHAGRILDQLTEGRWVALRAEEDGNARKLQVIRADTLRFDTSELSEGTADQVFLALRLAAVVELHNERTQAGEQALPLVLDDVLMAFDEVRTAGALKILENLAPGLQVIVFTHHRHVADAAAEFDRITVSRLPAATPIADPLDGELVRAQAQGGVVRLAVETDTARSPAPRADPKAVRAWAREQGIDVSAKGRVPQELVDRYLQTQP